MAELLQRDYGRSCQFRQFRSILATVVREQERGRQNQREKTNSQRLL